MTFSSEVDRILFHQLPTETQVFYTNWEIQLAKRGSTFHVEQVLMDGKISEVIVRITENYKLRTLDSKPT
jgi:hypothetical protein